MTEPLRITSKDNPLLQRLRKLARDGAGYRKTGELWLEGEHLCSALLQRGNGSAKTTGAGRCRAAASSCESPGR